MTLERPEHVANEALDLIAASPALRCLLTLIERLGPLSLPILILGESGTGKEILARAIHAASRRPGRFISVNCAALPSGLMESELFGHMRGAFTGAHHSYGGLFVAADGGTLCLDEVGDLPRELQAKLLRVLEEGTVRPLGTTTTTPINVRVIAATCRNLEASVGTDSFRADLWYRLAGAVFTVPPLRDRPEDIPQLIERFLISAASGHPPKQLAAGTLEYLMHLPWRGNVRELRHAVDRAAALGGAVLTPADFALKSTLPQRELTISELLALPRWDDIERTILDRALATHGSVSRVATAYGLPRSTLYDRLKRCGVLTRPERR